MTGSVDPIVRDIEAVSASPLFDADWYCREYPDVALLDVGPAEHFVRYGARMLRAPRGGSAARTPAQKNLSSPAPREARQGDIELRASRITSSRAFHTSQSRDEYLRVAGALSTVACVSLP